MAPSEIQTDGHFLPVEDRWRLGLPEWDRYGRHHPLLDDYPTMLGAWYDPYSQNVLKGDYPILGQNTFLDITGTAITVVDTRQIPTPTTPFESTRNPDQREFFGKPNQLLTLQFVSLAVDLFGGDASFKPVDWRIKINPIFNSNNLALGELANVNPDVRKGTHRERTYVALQEWFIEAKLADLSPHYDALSIRLGSQPFISDFRGFIFADINRGVRLFGNLDSNRTQFNLIYLNQAEKDTNSGLNTFDNRSQHIVIANVYQQDFIWPGFTGLASIHYNRDNPTFKFDRNNFLVRPDPVGVFQPHRLDVVYLGLAGDGHINRYNVSGAVYWAVGQDSLNPLANRRTDINAWLTALEVSYDRDYARFRTSFFYASGDRNPNNRTAGGFDSILDGTTFAGTFFSYWGRQRIGLFGVGLKNQFSLIPDLRSSKIQGQSNFNNPGLLLVNLGFDVDVTPKLKIINNCNFLWFDSTAPLETFVFQGRIDQQIGTDLSTGIEYRPLLSNNVILVGGLAGLIPSGGFRDLYNRFQHSALPPISAFAEMRLIY